MTSPWGYGANSFDPSQFDPSKQGPQGQVGQYQPGSASNSVGNAGSGAGSTNASAGNAFEAMVNHAAQVSQWLKMRRQGAATPAPAPAPSPAPGPSPFLTMALNSYIGTPPPPSAPSPLGPATGVWTGLTPPPPNLKGHIATNILNQDGGTDTGTGTGTPDTPSPPGTPAPGTTPSDPTKPPPATKPPVVTRHRATTPNPPNPSDTTLKPGATLPDGSALPDPNAPPPPPPAATGATPMPWWNRASVGNIPTGMRYDPFLGEVPITTPGMNTDGTPYIPPSTTTPPATPQSGTPPAAPAQSQQGTPPGTVYTPGYTPPVLGGSGLNPDGTRKVWAFSQYTPAGNALDQTPDPSTGGLPDPNASPPTTTTTPLPRRQPSVTNPVQTTTGPFDVGPSMYTPPPPTDGPTTTPPPANTPAGGPTPVPYWQRGMPVPPGFHVNPYSGGLEPDAPASTPPPGTPPPSGTPPGPATAPPSPPPAGTPPPGIPAGPATPPATTPPPATPAAPDTSGFQQYEKLFAPLFANQTAETERQLRAQAALSGNINSGGFGDTMGKALTNLQAEQGGKLADYEFQGTQADKQLAMQKYIADQAAQTELAKTNTEVGMQKYIADLNDATQRAQIKTNDDLQRWLNDPKNETIQKYGIDKNVFIEQYKAQMQEQGLAASGNAAYSAAVLNSTAQKYAIDQNMKNDEANRQLQLQLGLGSEDVTREQNYYNLLLGMAGLSPAMLQAILGNGNSLPPGNTIFKP